MPFFNRGRIKLNKTFFNSFSSGGGPIPPLPPIRPDSYLKYTFSQRDLEAAITDRVSGTDQLTTTIGTDVNAVQTIDGGIRTFEYGENLIPSSLLDWTGTGGQITLGSPNFTNNTGLGEVEILIGSDSERVILRSDFDVLEGNSTFSQVVLDAGAIQIAPSDILVEIGSGTLVEARLNGSAINANVARQFFAGDLLELVYNFAVAESVQMRLGIGVSTANTVAGMSIKLTQPMVNTGTERGPFVQPDGNPVTKYTQAFDVGTGALIEPSAVNLVINSGNPELYIPATVGSASPYVLTLNYAEAPDGTMTAHRLQMTLNGGTTTGDYTRFQSTSPTTTAAETEYTQSWFMKSNDTNTYQVGSLIKSQSSSDNYEVTPDWQRLSKTRTLATASSNCGLQLRGGTAFGQSDTIDILIWMSPKMGQQLEVGSVASSYIKTNGAPAQRDASTPTVPNGNLSNSETVVYDEYINLATFDIPTLLWAYADTRTQAAIGVIDSGNGLGDTLQLIRIDGSGTTLTPLSVTMTQGISRNDRVLTKAYLKSDLFTLVVENQTTGETQSASDASIAGTIGGLGPIALGDAGTVASTFSRKIVDFEITAYTAPSLPNFADNGDFDLTSGDFSNV